MGTVRARGVDVAYQRVGDGPPLVLVHGGMDDHRAWQPQLHGLADVFTVVAWDEPGAGRSSDVAPGFGLPDYADCLAAVIDAVGLGPALVAGVSWGGTVVLELYRRHPGTVAALVLADTYAGWRGSLPEHEVRRRVQEARSASVPDVRASSLHAALSAMAEADLRDVLPTIAVPTLLVWGDRDERSPLAVAHAFEAAIPAVELVVLPGAGHLSNLEAPAAFNDAVRRFAGTRL